MPCRAYDDEDRRFAPLDTDRTVLQEAMGSIGAGIIGRRMFDVTGGWGGNPPGGKDARYFVLTHSVPQQWTGPGSPFTFVTSGIDALAQARAAAGDKNVGIGGGANIIQQYLAAGLVDELRLHLAPVLLGAGRRLFENLGDKTIEMERTRVIESPFATHLYFTIRRRDLPHIRREGAVDSEAPQEALSSWCTR